MKFLKWAAIASFAMAALAIYGTVNSGASLGLAVTEVAILPLVLGVALTATYLLLAGARRLQRNR